MHSPEVIFDLLRSHGISLFTGVPDSLLKDFCAFVTESTSKEQHIIAANEGNAIAIAAGHYLGTGEPALVYMQNSGVGNAINPLLSLADSEVYSLPMLLMIGWRGEPGVNDEPQHVKQGRVMTNLMDALEIPWYRFSVDTECPREVITKAITQMKETQAPVALLVSKGAFAKYSLRHDNPAKFQISREQAIENIVEHLGESDLVVSTTGMTSRELYELRVKAQQGHSNDFLTVGAMGHTASIALGLAKTQFDRRVFCIDGDGSVLMHMGALGIVGSSGTKNIIHIVINNGVHDSVGGQPTVGFDIDLPEIAKSCNYAHVFSVDERVNLSECLTNVRLLEGPIFLEVKVNKGARDNLGRPKSTPIENKLALMSLIGSDNAL
jgi:phosphonopyruvate decarboxylase